MNHLDSLLTSFDDQLPVNEEMERNTYNKLRTLAYRDPENVNVIWRFARACYNYSNFSSDSGIKKAIILEGIIACEKILQEQNADLHKWYAVLQGLYSDFLPVADRIKNGFCFKEHITMALEMRPDDPGLHHLLGRFKYEVSALTWMERKIARALYAEPPSSTYEEAIDSFEQAEELAIKPHLENRLFLSKAYFALNQPEKSIYWLNKVCEEPAVTKEDQRVQDKAKELLTKYSG